MDKLNKKMKKLAQCLKQNNITVETLWNSNRKYIQYLVFYRKDVKWVGFVESSWTLPVFVGQKHNLDFITFSFGFFDKKMCKQYFLSITNYTPEDILWSLHFLDELIIENKSYVATDGTKALSAYRRWARINKLIY